MTTAENRQIAFIIYYYIMKYIATLLFVIIVFAYKTRQLNREYNYVADIVIEQRMLREETRVLMLEARFIRDCYKTKSDCMVISM
jgi:hypothetical protein